MGVVIRDAHPRRFIQVYSGISRSIQVYLEPIHGLFRVYSWIFRGDSEFMWGLSGVCSGFIRGLFGDVP